MQPLWASRPTWALVRMPAQIHSSHTRLPMAAVLPPRRPRAGCQKVVLLLRSRAGPRHILELTMTRTMGVSPLWPPRPGLQLGHKEQPLQGPSAMASTSFGLVRTRTPACR